MKTLLKIAAALLVALIGAVTYGAHRWREGTRQLRARLEAARIPIDPPRVDFRQLDGLPAPVQRYFRAALRDGQPMISAVHVRHHGTFNMSGTSEEWKHFTSDQLVITRRPGFDWDARIDILPGLAARGHDAYVAGNGILHVSLFGLFTVAHLSGPGAVAEGELLRFLAESAWYPTALLPGGGVEWKAVDDRSADATLTDGPNAVTLRFTFGADALIESVYARSRGRTIGKRIVPTPWRGRFSTYTDRDGMRIPLDGEVAWEPAGGPEPYWRGTIDTIDYEFSGGRSTR